MTSGGMTTGAGNDLERSTELARKMVCEWGMSDAMGPLTFGKKEEQIFLGREIAQHQDYSEDTAIRIDHEIKRFVQSNYERAKEHARAAPRRARSDRRRAPRPRGARRRAGPPHRRRRGARGAQAAAAPAAAAEAARRAAKERPGIA